MRATQDLADAIAGVCPIVGVSVGSIADKATWRIDFAQEATPNQQQAAAAVLASFDFNSTPDYATIDTAAMNAVLLQPGSLDRAELRTLFNHENRIRALEGKAAITQAQFISALQSIIR